MSCSVVQERYAPKIMAANTTAVVSKQSIGGFICTADGAISVEAYDGTLLVDEFPVTAGIYHPLPIYLGPNGGTVILSGGATGTLCI